MIDLPNFTTLDLGLYSFANAKSLVLNSNPFIIILLYFIDLPCLNQFIMKKNCFANIVSVTLTGMFSFMIYYRIDVPFMNGNYVSETGCFTRLHKNNITCDAGKINNREIIN